MPIRHSIWKVGSVPVPLSEVSLASESLLEDMIRCNTSVLSDEWLVIGCQVRTAHGGLIDLLALNQDGQLIIIELKRSQTPRDVVAQALDYASWAKELEAQDIADVYRRYSEGASLGDAFRAKFGQELDEELLNGSHQIVIVASYLDGSTERIVNYLNGMEVPINVIFFQVFGDGESQYLSRAWLIDPSETESKAMSSAGPKEEWNGEYYVSFGQDQNRDWEEARKWSFVSAGFGKKRWGKFAMLSPGDRIWVNVPGRGYVGVGIVKGEFVRARDFTVKAMGEPRKILDVAHAEYLREFADDEENSEYFVPVEWLKTLPLSSAVKEVGFFGNQNIVCRPRTTAWSHTVEQLKPVFGIED